MWTKFMKHLPIYRLELILESRHSKQFVKDIETLFY